MRIQKQCFKQVGWVKSGCYYTKNNVFILALVTGRYTSANVYAGYV